MISEEKRREIDLKIMKVTRAFLEHPVSIEEIASITGISSSSVQRYLNDKRIIELFDKDIYDQIQTLLKINRLESQKKGGVISTRKNEPLRDSIGRFSGNRRKN